eukprot:1180652-Prorocentrum_minimum.AAC.2
MAASSPLCVHPCGSHVSRTTLRMSTPCTCATGQSIFGRFGVFRGWRKGTPVGAGYRAQGPSYWAAGRTGLPRPVGVKNHDTFGHTFTTPFSTKASRLTTNPRVKHKYRAYLHRVPCGHAPAGARAARALAGVHQIAWQLLPQRVRRLRGEHVLLAALRVRPALRRRQRRLLNLDANPGHGGRAGHHGAGALAGEKAGARAERLRLDGVRLRLHAHAPVVRLAPQALQLHLEHQLLLPDARRQAAPPALPPKAAS